MSLLKQTKTKRLNHTVSTDDELVFVNFLGPMLSDVFIAYGKEPADLGEAGGPPSELTVVVLTNTG